MFARIVSGYGRDPALNASARKAPGSTAVRGLPAGSPLRGLRGSRGGGSHDDGEGKWGWW